MTKKIKTRWTKEEINNLKNGKVVPGRTLHSIKNQILRLGLISKKKARRPWTEKEVEKLKELHIQGFSAKQIYEMKIFNTGIFGIQHKLRRIGLVRGKNIHKLNKETREKLKDFLLNNYQGKTPKELTDIWNKENCIKISYKKVLSYLYVLKIKIPYYEVQKINTLRKKEKKLIEGSKSISTSVQTAIRAERVRLMRKRVERNLDIWSGLKIDNLQEVLKDDELLI